MKKLLPVLLLFFLPVYAYTQSVEMGIGVGYSKNRYRKIFPEGPLISGKALVNMGMIQYGMGVDMGAMAYKTYLVPARNPKKLDYYILKPYIHPYVVVNLVGKVEKLSIYAGVNMGYCFEKLVSSDEIYQINKKLNVKFNDLFTKNRLSMGVQLGISYPITEQLNINIEAAPHTISPGSEYKNYYLLPLMAGLRFTL